MCDTVTLCHGGDEIKNTFSKEIICVYVYGVQKFREEMQQKFDT